MKGKLVPPAPPGPPHPPQGQRQEHQIGREHPRRQQGTGPAGELNAEGNLPYPSPAALGPKALRPRRERRLGRKPLRAKALRAEGSAEASPRGGPRHGAVPHPFSFGFLPVAPLRGPLAASTAPKRRRFFVAAVSPLQRKIFSFCSFGPAGNGLGRFPRPCSEKGDVS